MVSEINTTEEVNEMWDACNPKVKLRLMQIARECDLACLKHPEWPRHKVIAAAIVAEESGELIRAALQAQFENAPEAEMTKEAIQTGAMALRFLLNSPIDNS